MAQDIKPGLFGQRHSNRDYTNPYCWGKNQFNSSFPASLIAYMHSKGVKPVFLKINGEYELKHSTISADKLLGIDPLSDEAFYNFEAGFAKFEKYYYIAPEETKRDPERRFDAVIVNSPDLFD